MKFELCEGRRNGYGRCPLAQGEKAMIGVVPDERGRG
jgi:hypothetical protein